MPVPRARVTERRARRSGSSADGVLYPLDVFYARAGIGGPTVKPVTPDRIPQPYHDLLVHENEMTATLERHFGGPLAVRVLSSFSKDRSYFRRVLLALESTGRPVAMGAVRLRLERFKPAVRARILAERTPLGRIFREAGVLYESRPTAFVQLTPNAEMLGLFWMAGPRTIYGRRTEVTTGGAGIGDIVEIIPLV